MMRCSLTSDRASTMSNPRIGQRRCATSSKILLPLHENAPTMSMQDLKMRPLQPSILQGRGIPVALLLLPVFVSIRTDVYEREIISICTCIIRVDRRSIAVLRC